MLSIDFNFTLTSIGNYTGVLLSQVIAQLAPNAFEVFKFLYKNLMVTKVMASNTCVLTGADKYEVRERTPSNRRGLFIAVYINSKRKIYGLNMFS